MRTPLLSMLLLLAAFTQAQNLHRCGTVEAIQMQENLHLGYKSAIDGTFEQVKNLVAQKSVTTATVYHIPVVVHIVYNSPEENIPNDLVYSQIARLNRDYRRLNEDTSDTRSEFMPVAADAGIEFYLAGTDPDGNSSGGITRTQTTRTDFAPDFFGNGMDDVKQSSLGGVDAWDTDNYLNIWVCNLVGSNPLFQIFGFAYPPASAPNWPANSEAPSTELQGVVIHYEVFGDGNPLATGALSVSDKGRTAVHEVGHYLGLRHIWGDALFTDGCAEDDGIDDTPNASANAAQQCSFSNNTCVDSPVDFPDMIENYMDYAQDQCMNLFTQGQVDIMRQMLETARTDLADGSVEPSGINDVPFASSIDVFPNPSNGNFVIQVPQNQKISSIKLVDLNGRLVVEKSNLNQTGLISADWILDAGGYMLELQFDSGLVSKKLVVY